MLLRLVNKIRGMSAPVKASACFAICALLQKGILLVTTPIFTRLLPPDQYGIYSLYASCLSFVTILCTLNLNYNVFFKGYTEFEGEKDSYVSSMEGLTTLITLLVFSTFLFAPDIWTSLTGLPDELIFCMFLEMLFAPAWYFWLTKQRAEYKYIAASIITVMMLLVSTVVAVVAVWLTGYGVLARIYPVVAVDVGVGLFFYVLNLIRGRKLVSLKFWKFALAFNLPLMPHYLADTVLSQADRVMIGSINGVEYTAIYSVAYAVAMLVALFNSSVNASLIPWTYEKLHNGDTASERSIYRVGTGLSIAMAGLACVTIAMGPELIAVLGPEEYSEATIIMPPVGMSVTFMFYISLFTNVETYYGENKYVALVSCVGAIGNVALNAILLPVFGFAAAGWTTFACYALMAGGHWLFMRRIRREKGLSPFVYNDKLLFAVAVGLLVFGVFMLAVYNMPVIRYLIIGITLVLAFHKRAELFGLYRQLKK